MRHDLIQMHLKKLTFSEGPMETVLVDAVKALLKDKKAEPNQDNSLPYTLKLAHSEWALLQNVLLKSQKDPYAPERTKKLIELLYKKVRGLTPITKSKL